MPDDENQPGTEVEKGSDTGVDYGKELGSIDFENLIGGPLIAVVNAQAQSAMATVNFIRSVGFYEDTEANVTRVTNVDFGYSKKVVGESGKEEVKNCELHVPLLSIVPIPYLRVEEVNIDFLAKITSIQEKEVLEDTKTTADFKGKVKWGWGSARLAVNYSNQRNTRTGEKVQREYSMGVKVRAVQEEMPAGMEKILAIMESLIEETEAQTTTGSSSQEPSSQTEPESPP
ncbi:MAG: DUF2589 domain-containing protein [Candidatus Methanofastidiosia archaeon]